MKKNVALATMVALVLLTGLYLTGCKKNNIKLSTTEDVNIVGYLQKSPDSFSLFIRILERTETTAFLNAYGAYTLFAPTNSGVTKWLTASGYASVEAADLNVLKDLVKFHLLGDTVTTGSFKDGRLPIPTMQGQYLITGVSFDAGISSYTVNRQALVMKSNIRTGNGIIHEIDYVLLPARLTIAKQLEANPNYSIFVQAMRETGYYDMLNTVDPDTSKRWITVMAETNKALADSGIASYAALKAKYSKTSSPTNVNDSLHMYMAYHILTGIKFLGDIITSPSHITLQPQEVISTKLINEEVLINEDEFNGIVEKGVKTNRKLSDNAATNGVWHQVDAHYMVKYRKPTALFWDVSSFDEIKKLPAFYKKATNRFPRPSESDQPIKDIYWGWGPLAGTNWVEYAYGTSSIVIGALNNDCTRFPLGLPNRPIWFEFRTPPIIKGRYKVWMCYSSRKQSSSSNCLCDVRVNGELMQRTMNFTVTRPSGTDAELEAIGWKRYTENTGSQYAARLVGTIDFKTTEKQTVRITPLSGTQDDNYLDMIHFIPVDENQVLPRFKSDGTKIYL